MQVFSVFQQVVYMKSKFKTIGDAEEEYDGLTVESYMGNSSGDVKNDWIELKNDWIEINNKIFW